MWKAIPTYPGYEVSTEGQVRSLRFGKTKELSQQLSSTGGYAQVRIGVQGKGRTLRVHRLVAETFLPNPNAYTEVDHIDRNRTNNRVSNLRWVTRSENLLNTVAQANPRHAILQRGNSFQVRFKRDGQSIYLPSCSTLEEAITQRDAWLRNLPAEV